MIRSTCVIAVVLLTSAVLVAAPATTQSDAAVISPQAREVLAKVKEAYTQLKSLDHTGKITGDFDVDGQKANDSAEFVGSFSSPNLFRLEIGKSDLIGCNGQRLYVYLKNRNMFAAADAPKGRVAAQDLPEPFGDLINAQDPSLRLAIASDPAEELARDFVAVDKVDDVTLGDISYVALKFKGQPGRGVTTILFEPTTHLLRRVSVDVTPQLLKRGAADVKKAVVTIDYPTSKSNPTTQPEQFAWAPPPGARDAADAAGGGAAEAMLGKPAPAFKQKDLNGKTVTLADVKGKVVVFDFWATWCGPCVYSLPKIDALYKEMKDAGVVFYAVNVGEDKDLVGGFIASKNLSLPVLLDEDMKMTETYSVDGYPTTFVVGKDGIIRKVFSGVGPDTEARLRDAINAALNTSK